VFSTFYTWHTTFTVGVFDIIHIIGSRYGVQCFSLSIIRSRYVVQYFAHAIVHPQYISQNFALGIIRLYSISSNEGHAVYRRKCERTHLRNEHHIWQPSRRPRLFCVLAISITAEWESTEVNFTVHWRNSIKKWSLQKNNT